MTETTVPWSWQAPPVRGRGTAYRGARSRTVDFLCVLRICRLGGHRIAERFGTPAYLF
ncbi:hypothetical protein JOF35_005241, partial [Streptomyces demainii]|nr:hypothetical protein [Streptomyces demainii]